MIFGNVNKIAIPDGEIKAISANGVVIWSAQIANYLRVSPSEVQWITPDQDIVYQVESNTEWTIT